ncbi:MAG: serine/threonine protein kinase [Myxococcales bacterium FL481]|nr:MAG: serine/threonine protein kinase [Myxococcales bacterium FL481]
MSQPASDTRDYEALVGTVLAGRYRIDRLLGVGAMGAVFRGHQLTLKRDVAIKVLHADLSGNPEIAARFKREAQSVARLEHPNIVSVVEYGSTHDGRSFIVMQLLEGFELDRLLGKPMSVRRAVLLISQVLSGLEHAHGHDVVHRDLKPENVFVTRDHEGKETLKLVDFGISKMTSEDDSNRTVTRAGLVFGTPLYMSPEQATGSPVDARADLYSAGVILYEMLAGKPPFDNDDPVALIRMQVSVDPPALGTVVPPQVAQVVYRMLAKDRAQRFASAAEARAALEAAVSASEATDDEAAGSNPELYNSSSGSRRVAPEVEQLATASVPRKRNALVAALVFAGGTGVVGLLAWLALPRIELDQSIAAPPADDTATTTAPAIADIGAEDLAAIDRQLLAKNHREALLLIKPLRDASPDNAQLLVREGRALALRRSKRATALNRYAQALENDATLIDDPAFLAELYALLEDTRLREAALDFAVQKLGKHGHRFLLTLVNQTKPDKSLRYTDRHRALTELRSDPDSAKLIDERMNLARDLWQARSSPAPCENFRDALTQISAFAPADDYFVTPLDKAKVPKPKDDKDAAFCVDLQKRLDAARAQLEQALAAEATATGDEERPTTTGPAHPTRQRSRSKPGKRATDSRDAGTRPQTDD